MRCVWWISWLVQFAAVGADSTVRLPDVPPDWRITLVATAPEIRHPSVVCTAPDGRVFVAEDPMDISAPANAAQGRILCFHPNGRRTVFAEHLYAVFGMQYIEGKLYVLHNPKFSVFDANGETAGPRIDLIESTNPNPWALEWNDHVPANFRLAMDGYLYVAVGDKGIYGAVGRDGQRVDLHGGGILRLRPNGTQLEVYCTGVRNILDVALTAEDEIFTYDNTDEQQWMGRLTHMADGGFYGYPYDFIPQRPYTLWMMADFGGGAATGALAYTEDALPPEYHDNLFLADFGKRQIMRVRIERSGGTFRVVAKDDLFLNPPEDFRPVGIALSTDGLSLYICDWNHRDVKANVSAGRLWKLTYQHEPPSNARSKKVEAAQKPSWFVPAASGLPFQASTAELLTALSHPAKSVRLVAQRELARRAAVDPLTNVLDDSTSPVRARIHAIWALHAIGPDHAASQSIQRAAADREPAVRRQAIRALGNRRAAGATTALLTRLADPDKSVRFQAATALGRIADPVAIPPLVRALAEEDLFTRYAIFTALNRIGRSRPGSWTAIALGLESDSHAIREGAEFAMRDTYDTNLLDLLVAICGNPRKGPSAREAATRLIAGLHHRTPEWRGEWWAYHPVNAPPPAKSMVWDGTSTVLQQLERGLSDPNGLVRRACLEGLLDAKHAAAAPNIRRLLQTEPDTELRALAVTTLGILRDSASATLLAALLHDSATTPPLLSAAISAATNIGGTNIETAIVTRLDSGTLANSHLAKAIEAAGSLKIARAFATIVPYAAHASEEVRTAAQRTLLKLDPDRAVAHLGTLIDHLAPEIQRSAIAALGSSKAKGAIQPLRRAFAREQTRAHAILALALSPSLEALDEYVEGLRHPNAPVRLAAQNAIRTLRKEALPLIQSKLAQLPLEITSVLKELYENDERARLLFASTPHAATPDDYLAYALEHRGDLAVGRTLFYDVNRLACTQCHTVANQGRRVGPDLTAVGAQFSRRELAESILFPSRAIREGYQSVSVETKDGESVSGLLSSENANELTLLDVTGNLQRISKQNISARRASGISLMPAGLAQALTFKEFASLISYLETLRPNSTP